MLVTPRLCQYANQSPPLLLVASDRRDSLVIYVLVLANTQTNHNCKNSFRTPVHSSIPSGLVLEKSLDHRATYTMVTYVLVLAKHDRLMLYIPQ
jgi:hypothetical protein